MKREYVKIEVTAVFEYDETKTTLEEAKETATCLAMNPNYHTVEQGVKLLDLL